MLRLSLTLLSVSWVAALCNMASTCGDCLTNPVCVWKNNGCWAATSYPFCAADNTCYQFGEGCPLLSANVNLGGGTNVVANVGGGNYWNSWNSWGLPYFTNPVATSSGPVTYYYGGNGGANVNLGVGAGLGGNYYGAWNNNNNLLNANLLGLRLNLG